jgi:hypothetical protein
MPHSEVKLWWKWSTNTHDQVISNIHATNNSLYYIGGGQIVVDLRWKWSANSHDSVYSMEV